MQSKQSAPFIAEPVQDSAAPKADERAATSAAKAAMKVLPQLIHKPINLVLQQQQQSRPKGIGALKRPADSMDKIGNYSDVMAEFKQKALRDLTELVPKGTQKGDRCSGAPELA